LPPTVQPRISSHHTPQAPSRGIQKGTTSLHQHVLTLTRLRKATLIHVISTSLIRRFLIHSQIEIPNQRRNITIGRFGKSRLWADETAIGPGTADRFSSPRVHGEDIVNFFNQMRRHQKRRRSENSAERTGRLSKPSWASGMFFYSYFFECVRFIPMLLARVKFDHHRYPFTSAGSIKDSSSPTAL